jgi:hypothetical protein
MMPETESVALAERPEWAPLTLGPIGSHEQYSGIADYLKTIKAFQRRVTDFFKPHKDRVLAAHRALCDDERKALDPALNDELACKRLMLAWDSEQDRLRREEERRRQEQAQRDAEERRIQEAAALEREAQASGDAGLLDEALEMMEQPVVAAAIAPVEKATPKVQGIAYKEIWKFRITDVNRIPREYLKVDDVKIGGVVRSMKGATKIPGIECYPEKTVAAGGR